MASAKWRLLILILLTAPAWARGAEFFVAPSAVPTGNGSRKAPWDLQTALSQPPVVKPGDTLWLRGGVHRLCNRTTRFFSSLKGTQNAPIVVRQYPGERAAIDGNLLQAGGGWVVYRDFEIFNSITNRCTAETGPFPRAWWVPHEGKQVDLCVSGLDLQAPNIKAINLLIHDSIGGGVGVNLPAKNTEIYGCLIYYNGWQGGDHGHGHGIYGQNAAPYVKSIYDNLIFENLGLGMQFTGNGPAPVADNLDLEGTAFFMNGNMASAHQANLLIGAFRGLGQDPTVIGNFIYDTQGTLSDCNLGYGGGLANLVLRGNYFGTAVAFASNTNMTVAGNVFGGGCNLAPKSFPNNVFARPATNACFVRPNRYEAGRANLVIFNWQKLNQIAVDISAIGLRAGEAYELHNAADFVNDVVFGVYNGDPILVPMTGRSTARPVGSNLPAPASTFPEFGAFVIRKRSAAARQARAHQTFLPLARNSLTDSLSGQE